MAMTTKVLIIDDNEADARLIKEIFKTKGIPCDFLVAKSGEEGLEKIKETKVGIVILDTRLPGMDGFETCQKIKELYKDSVKVIMLTGFVDAVDAGRARKAGSDDYCVKTVDCEPVLEAIKNLLPKTKSY